jgi:coenzyme F420-0:L-glutamate ligase/coenzyme F420-1:gamma-L-glutamate ligase
MTVRIVPVLGIPEVRAGDDLSMLIAGPILEAGVEPGAVVVVTQKIVSKAEGRVVSLEGTSRSAWIERETVRVVARRGDLVIAETRHGFVCANAGVDASNVPEGSLCLLPEDPDGSAERLRASLSSGLGVDVGVLVTDTFGRPWRQGVVNVAIGCAGLPALVDLRGQADHHGRALEATVVALADELAAASGLVMQKAARIPVALVVGLERPEGPPGRASHLVRPPDDDLFPQGVVDP